MASGGRLAEYLKLARSFNLALTGVAPVLAALAAGEGSLLRLFILFIVGLGAHIYGFVLNDYIDMRIDKLSTELSQRPLISGSITPTAALNFAICGLVVMLGFGYALVFGHPRVVMLLVMAAVLATIYNFISKNFPGMDIFVAGAVFFLCLFGAASVTGEPLYIPQFAMIVCALGGIQVLFMNIVAGGLKDIDHDSKGGGRTLAVALGCKVAGRKDTLTISPSFRGLAYFIQLLFLLFLFAPFVLGIYGPYTPWNIVILTVLLGLSVAMVAVSYRLLNQRAFVRGQMRKFIGIHYILNYILTPVMMSLMSPYFLLLILVFPAGFVLSNLALAGDAMKPKTM